MSTPIKKPKSKVSSDLMGDRESPSQFKLSIELKKELSAKGLSWRFINIKRHREAHGYSRGGWLPYQTEKKESKGSLDFTTGVDPEGYIRRGDQVLAVRTKEQAAEHKRIIDRKNLAQASYNKQAASELRKLTQTKVFEGYDENQDTSNDDE